MANTTAKRHLPAEKIVFRESAQTGAQIHSVLSTSSRIHSKPMISYLMS